jgi:hypothetical protein
MLYRYYALTALADQLLDGEGNWLEKLVTDRLEQVGRVWLKEKVNELAGFDLARRTKRAYATGGLSEIRRFRNSWLSGGALSARSGFVGRGLRDIASGFNTEINRKETEVLGSDVRRAVVDRMENALLGEKPDKDQAGRQQQTWSGSRQKWLDAKWRHTWESQPRDPQGQWKPGRLKHPYMSKGARKIRTKRRAVARQAAKQGYSED